MTIVNLSLSYLWSPGVDDGEPEGVYLLKAAGEFDFSEVLPVRGFKYKFRIQNKANELSTLESFKSGCSCTTPPETPITIPAHESIEVECELDLTMKLRLEVSKRFSTSLKARNKAGDVGGVFTITGTVKRPFIIGNDRIELSEVEEEGEQTTESAEMVIKTFMPVSEFQKQSDNDQPGDPYHYEIV